MNREKSFKLVEKMHDTVIIHGDARDIDLLKEEGIRDTDAFIALTDSSETNILACLTAKRTGRSKNHSRSRKHSVYFYRRRIKYRFDYK